MRHKTTQTQQNLINNGEKGRLQEKQSKVHPAQHESHKSSRENISHRLEMKAEMQHKSLFLFSFFLFFHSKRLLVVNLARAPVSSREVVDVCSIHKACWETVAGLRRTPRTRRTGPSAFRNGQMATVEAFQSSRSLCDGGAALPGRLCPAVCPAVCPSVRLSAADPQRFLFLLPNLHGFQQSVPA